MKTAIRVFVVVALASLIPLVQAASRTISASTDANGNQHPGTSAVKGPATVTCLSATQSVQKPGDPPATCFVTGPGVGSQVQVGKNVGASGAGTVTLICNGTGRLACSARIDD